MIIAIANHKGGVGKTTAAVNLSAALAERKRRILIVDLDTQGNVSLALGAVVEEGEPDVGEVLLRRRKIGDVIRSTSIPNVDVLPSAKLSLSEAAERINLGYHKQEHLKRELEPVLGRYDDIVIDCPPSLGVLTGNAVFAADLLIAPFTLDAFAYSGLSDLLAYVEDVRRRPLPVRILVSQYEHRASVMNRTMEEAIAEYDKMTLATRIPRTDVVRKAHAAQRSVLSFSSTSAVSEAFRSVAKETLRALG